MPVPLSTIAIEEKNKLANPDSIFLLAMEIEIPGLEVPIRVVANTENITWKGHDWVAFPFDIDEIVETDSGEVPRVDVRVGNVSREMEYYIHEYDRYCKENGFSPVICKLFVINSLNLRTGLEFDGESDHVDCGDALKLRTDEELTYSLRFSFISVEDESGLLGKDYRAEGDLELYRKDRYIFWHGPGDAYSVHSYYPEYGEPVPGKCYHLVVTREFGAENNEWIVKFYDNGALVATTTSTTEIATSDKSFRIGREGGLPRYANAKISDVRVYNRALSQSEVALLYEGKEISNDGLVGHWPMNEQEGNTVYDQSGNNNDGTIHGATWIGKATPERELLYELVQPRTDPQWVTFTLGASNPFNLRFPRRRMIPTCEWKFKSLECGYDGMAENCNKSFARCKELDNAPRFGGFYATGRSRI